MTVLFKWSLLETLAFRFRWANSMCNLLVILFYTTFKFSEVISQFSQHEQDSRSVFYQLPSSFSVFPLTLSKRLWGGGEGDVAAWFPVMWEYGYRTCCLQGRIVLLWHSQVRSAEVGTQWYPHFCSHRTVLLVISCKRQSCSACGWG